MSSRETLSKKLYRESYYRKIFLKTDFIEIIYRESYYRKIIILSRNIDSQVLEKYRPSKSFRKNEVFEKFLALSYISRKLNVLDKMRRFR